MGEAGDAGDAGDMKEAGAAGAPQDEERYGKGYEEQDEEPDEELVRLLRGLWPALPALLTGSVAVCTAATLTVLLAPGVTPVSVLLAAVLTGPVHTALLGSVGRIASGEEATVRLWLADLRALGGFGLRQALPVAVAAAVFLTSWLVWGETRNALVLPSLAVSGAATVLAVPGLPAALALGTVHRRLRGTALWHCALRLTVRFPVRFLSAPALTAVGVWTAFEWTASLLLLVPAPVAAVTVAAVRTLPAAVRPVG